MRALEIGILIALVPVLIGLFRRSRRPGRLRVFAWTALALMLLHFGMEGYRWQMTAAYLLVVWGCLQTLKKAAAKASRNSRERKALRMTRAALLLLAYSATLFLAVNTPVFVDPMPTGPYSVGTTRLRLVDGSREDRFAPDPHTPRELLVVTWYPADVAPGAQPEPFWPEAPATVPVVAQMYHLLPLNFLRHLRRVRSHSYPDAPMARAPVPFPVLIFSHGYASTPRQNTVQMEELASHGFVVCSTGHTYESAALSSPDGRVVPGNRAQMKAVMSDNSRRKGTQSLEVWVADTRFAVDELTKINAGAGIGAAEPSPRFTHRLDLTRLGVFGMSFGGATAGEFCRQDPRCKAGMNMDGFQMGYVMDQPLSVPFLYFVHAGYHENDPVYARSRGDLYKVEIRGSEHGNFSDASLVLPILKSLGLLGSIDGLHMERILNAYTVMFFQKYLQGKEAPLLDGPSYVDQYPEVLFTARKGPTAGK